MMKSKRNFLSLCLVCTFLVLSLPAFSEIYKYVNPDGTVEYTNVQRNGAKPAALSNNLSSIGGKAAPTKTSTSATTELKPTALVSKVDPFTQKGRDDVRKRVLTQELTQEEKAYLDAQTLYSGGTPAAQTDETLGGAKYLDRVARLRQSVQTHEKNIAAIKQEIANLK
jgi:Domain of unknown function (DUF4124)